MKHHGCRLEYQWSRYSLRHKRTTNFNQIVHNYYVVPIIIMKSRFWELCVPHTCLVDLSPMPSGRCLEQPRDLEIQQSTCVHTSCCGSEVYILHQPGYPREEYGLSQLVYGAVKYYCGVQCLVFEIFNSPIILVHLPLVCHPADPPFDPVHLGASQLHLLGSLVGLSTFLGISLGIIGILMKKE